MFAVTCGVFAAHSWNCHYQLRRCVDFDKKNCVTPKTWPSIMNHRTIEIDTEPKQTQNHIKSDFILRSIFPSVVVHIYDD